MRPYGSLQAIPAVTISRSLCKRQMLCLPNSSVGNGKTVLVEVEDA